MRTYQALTQARFAKQDEAFMPVTLPHTWNNLDGQDGGGDYWRGDATYEIILPNPTRGLRQYIEFRGVNHIATVFCNGKPLGVHEGGFSTFRFDLTDCLQEDNNLLTVQVNNAESHVYPQRADFTFYGGIYRDVYFLEVESAHFDLLKRGSDAVFVTAQATGETRLDVFPVNCDGCNVQVTLLDGDNNAVFTHTQQAMEHTEIVAHLQNPHLWDCVEDPYCYQARVALLGSDGKALDEVTVTYGYRSFRADPEKGFILNGRSYPLHGVCRHQDRKDKGWAISREDHLQDAELIREIGANTVRLAHYQHDQYFYDLCDKMGFAVWAEIPYISVHMESKEAHDNTLSQMTELIVQNYNHPSIITWGIGNEILIGGDKPGICPNLRDLNALAKGLDPNRPTTIAHLNRTPFTDPQTRITDIQSYNIYYGWYVGAMEDNGPFLDEYHKLNPDQPLGVSEYGVDNLLCWHSANPFNHDYTEEYAVSYHQEMLKTFRDRPYLWATHMWNMFDFAADARNEGGIKGLNCKGLITYDRSIKKDAFFLYKAWWTKTPMVYIAGRRFTDRAPGERTVQVFTNAEKVLLTLNGTAYTAPAVDHIAVFEDLPLTLGANTLTAAVDGAEDTVILNGVEKHNGAYDLPDLASAMQAGNWFLDADELEEDYGENGYNANVPFKELLTNPRCMEIVKGWVMAKEGVDVSDRFKFVSMLNNFAVNPQYYDRTLRMSPSMMKMMQDSDYEVLNKLLRTVKRK